MERAPTETAEDESVRVWMVERTYARDEQNVVVTYATPDGERFVRKHRNRRVLLDPVTAALDVSPDRLEAVEETERRQRYAAEAARMADRRDPDDEV
ncbi:hypothetical protein M0R88_05265 [Halorussus gelatinilyticus]|uniref:DUF7967 domain-containing protein n=1 Tax=Halorussus gelatinilyticus TaxID=2937524 RepID=A0A8U0ILJ3_9EURY|nr:hypothetical protein [Halorussus gelatinilyticus]UPW01515.1 hypothetical protein M0R88_05265 [Halorussus gelatinilyticus]